MSTKRVKKTKKSKSSPKQSAEKTSSTILILDFGSQYTQLIARRVREHNVYCKIVPYHISLDQIIEEKPAGVILSGSPANVYGPKAPFPDMGLFDLDIPVLGICYGLQLLARHFKGKVHKSKKREYGFAKLHLDKKTPLFKKLPKQLTCWMSHGDKLDKLPKGFVRLAHTANAPVAAIGNLSKHIYGVQFHPEVVHSEKGTILIRNFLYEICKLKGDWTPKAFIKESIKEIRKQVGKDKVVLGLSGGVDSSVAAVLLHKAIGKQLVCIFVDNGLLRLNEAENVVKTFRNHFKMNLKFANARKLFLDKLDGVRDPEKKRKIIGRTFIEVFEKEAKKLGKVPYLAQGTLYPDVIESVSVHGGPTSTIKSHHNVGGLPKRLKFKLVEPLKELFKDEVRAVGRSLGLPAEIIDRHPFPGPGLGIRIIGNITKQRLDLLKRADQILIDELRNSGNYDKVWQALTVLLPIKSVGVMGDERTYENVASIRAVTSQDGMTADWAKIPTEVLGTISNRIINEVRGINRVCYDISSKPPATIEWE